MEQIVTQLDHNQKKWDIHFLMLAGHCSLMSKDPSTQVGAVLVDAHRRVISTGFNGLPQRVLDTHERLDNREVKYDLIIHAEMNALIFAQRSLHGATLYTYPFMSCSRCATMMIQAGIVRHVAPVCVDIERQKYLRTDLTAALFNEANISVATYDLRFDDPPC